MGVFHTKGGGRKVRARPRSLSSLGSKGGIWDVPRHFAGMSRTPRGVQKVCAKEVRAHFSFPILLNLVSHYSAIADTILCDAPYSAIGFRGKLFLRYPPSKASLDCDRPLLRERSGSVAAIVSPVSR